MNYYDIEFEKQINNMVLDKPELFENISITPSDFYGAETRTVFEKMYSNYKNDIPYNYGMLKADFYHIIDNAISKEPVSSIYFGEYQKRVKKLAGQRKIVNLTLEMQNMALKEKSYEEIMEYVTDQNIQAYQDTGTKTLDELFTDYKEMFQNGTLPKRMKFGWEIFDNLINMELGGVLGVAGASGVGKSVLSQIIGMKLAQSGNEVYFASLEMTDMLVLRRSIQNLLRIRKQDINKNLDNQDLKMRIEASKRFAINPKSGITFNEIMSDVKKYEKTKKKKVNVLIVDYLQYVKANGKSRFEGIDSVAVQLKEIAKKLNVLLIPVIQLNRYNDGGTIVKMAHMDGASAIEKSCDNIIGLFSSKRVEEKPLNSVENKITIIAKDEESEILCATVCKGREGSQGEHFLLKFNGEYLQLDELGLSKQPFLTAQAFNLIKGVKK